MKTSPGADPSSSFWCTRLSRDCVPSCFGNFVHNNYLVLEPVREYSTAATCDIVFFEAYQFWEFHSCLLNPITWINTSMLSDLPTWQLWRTFFDCSVYMNDAAPIFSTDHPPNPLRRRWRIRRVLYQILNEKIGETGEDVDPSDLRQGTSTQTTSLF
jgi:hypothetical protein